MSHQALVLDANILVRAVLGQRVYKLLNQYYDTTAFFAADETFADAENISRQYLRRAAWIGTSARLY